MIEEFSSKVEVVSALHLPSHQGKWWKISTEARRQEDEYYEMGMFGYSVADCADVQRHGEASPRLLETKAKQFQF